MCLDNPKNAQLGNEEDQDNPEKEDDSPHVGDICLYNLCIFLSFCVANNMTLSAVFKSEFLKKYQNFTNWIQIKVFEKSYMISK